ncbi:MAG: type I-E CRISPR-associated protein Cse1/CasA [Chloroflexi bacterium]|nr:type I-E CRISPR-associated protein Cse1/CasA [Chloroflexota bacterium]
MTYSFNLIDQKWIPCVHLDGHLEEYSLRETLTQAHTFRSIQGNFPLETASIYRLILAVLHSTYRGPHDHSDWAELWSQRKWDDQAIIRYLNSWQDRFDIFHPSKPFYQIADDRAKPKSIISLVMDMAAGNMATLFDHHNESEGEAISPAKAARTIITVQTFGLAGLALPGAPFTDAPWARGVIFFVEGSNLFETLALNMLPYPDEKRNNMSSSNNDKPAWENDDPYKPVRQIPMGYLDYLTWQNRKVLLIPEGDVNSPIVRSMTVAPGLRLDANILDPMKLYRTGKKEAGFISTRFTEDRALWRDSATFFRLNSQKGDFPPKTFDFIADLAANDYIPRQQIYRIMALGMANDQAKIEFFQEQHLPLILDYLENEELVEQLNLALELAEQICFSLRVASQWLALLIVSPKSDGLKWSEIDRISKTNAENLITHWNVSRYYWQQLEIPFMQFLGELPKHPESIQTWRSTVQQTAWNALEQAINYAGNDAVALKAAVRARNMLGDSIKEFIPKE